MATNPLGVEIPQGLDPFDPQGDMVELANSLGGMVIVPVPNVAGRDALVGSLGWTPSPTRPLWVNRADAPAGLTLERTVNGTTWQVYSDITRTPFILAGGGDVTMTGASGTFTVNIPNVPAHITVWPHFFIGGANQIYGTTFVPSVTSRTTVTVRYNGGQSGLTIPYQWTAMYVQAGA